MPIYAFTCGACSHCFDRLQKLSDADPAACPACGADAVKRQLTAPSFRLSGSGWYETDFKKDGDKKRNLTEKAEAAAAQTDAKTDAKADGKPVDAKPADAKPAASKGEAKVEAKPAKTEASAAAKPAAGTP